MLSYGSIKNDEQYISKIQNNLILHNRITENTKRYQEYLQEKLNFFFNNIVSKSNHYQSYNLDINSILKNHIEEFENISMLEKQQLRTLTEEFKLKHDLTSYFKAKTSGSTGVPIEMFFDSDYFLSFYSHFLYFLNHNHIWPEPFSVNMITTTVFKRIIDYYIIQPAVNFSYYYQVNINLNNWASGEAILDFIASKNPMILRGMPSSIDFLIKLISKFNKLRRTKNPISPELIITMSEMLLPNMRQRIENCFDAQVFNEYGLSEIGGVVARECSKHNGMHINILDYYVETVDEYGKNVPEGKEGEIIITNLYNSTIPLLRYRTGDFGILSNKPCSCGSIAPRITKLTGRMITRFSDPRGLIFNPFDVFGELILNLPIRQFQMIQDKNLVIILYYISENDISNNLLVKALKKKIFSIFGDENFFQLIRIRNFENKGKFQSFLRL